MNLGFPIASVEGTLAIAFLLAFLAPPLARAVRIPVLAIYVAAGTALGPAAFGILDGEGFLGSLGAFGALYAFFLAGAELDLGASRRRPGASLMLALPPFAIVAASMVAAALALGASAPIGMPPSLTGMLAVAAALSSIALPPRDQGRLPENARLGISGAATLSAVLLVVTLSLAASLADGIRLSLDGLWLLPFSLALVAALVLASSLFFRRVKVDGTIETTFALCCAFLAAAATSFLGFQAGLGAFAAGLVAGRFVPDGGMAMRRIRFLGESFLLPFFALLAGASIDPRSLVETPLSLAFLLGAPIAVIAIRALSVAIASSALKYSKEERRAAFAFGSGQGALTLAALFACKEAGLLDPASYGAAVAACLILSIVGHAIAGLPKPAPSDESTEAGPSVPERVLVALGNPKSLRGLMETAFLLRRRGSEEALYPLCVLGESADDAKQREAERSLAQAMALSNAAGVSAIPTLRMGTNPGEGIAAALAEVRASTALIGWNKAPKAVESSFGSVIDHVISGYSGQIVVTRTVPAFGDAPAYAIVFPPLASSHPGFDRAIALIASIFSRKSARLSFYALEPDAQPVREAIRNVRFQPGGGLRLAKAWKDIPGLIKRDSGVSFGILALAIRPGDPSWHPSSERLPYELSELFPEAPFAALYLEGSKESKSPSPVDLFSAALAEGRVVPNLPGQAIFDGISAMLALRWDTDRKTRNKLAQLFTDIAQRQPIELESGVLLLHAHLAEVDAPLVIFGSKPAGYRLMALSEPARVIVLLCAPDTQTPEEHLSTLTGIAAALKREGLVEALKASTDRKDLERFL